MKRRELISRIARAARKHGAVWELEREGGNHTVYKLDGEMIPIPRHNEIGERLVMRIYSECAEVLGKGWWKK